MNQTVNMQAMGLNHMLEQASGVGLIPLVLLVLMSIGSGYYLLLKSWSWCCEKRRSRRFLSQFWESRTLGEAEQQVREQEGACAYGRLAQSAFQAAQQLDAGSGRLGLGSADEFLLRVLRQSIARERLQLETGLTFLASVGSAAPFVGLFGTVWGIYHALLAIGAAGQSSLDKVAGPVGEALIMTGFGLAVALPSVLIFNLFTRLNRLRLAALEGFAHDLYALFTTGSGRVAAQTSQPQEVV